MEGISKRLSISIKSLDECLPQQQEERDYIIQLLEANNFSLIKPSAWSSTTSNTSGKILLSQYLEDIKKYNLITGLPPKPSGCIRLSTYNVHFWLSPSQKITIDDVFDFATTRDIDVLCLQEAILPIPREMIDQPINLLGFSIPIQEMEHSGIYTSNHYHQVDPNLTGTIISTDGWGRANLYKFIHSLGYHYISQVGASTTHSKPGSYFGNAVISKPQIYNSYGLTLSSYGQGRGAAIAYYDRLIGNKPGVIVSVHLDVFDESGKIRLKQLTELLDHIDSKYKGVGIIILGDFNALRYEDYTEKERGWLSHNNQGNDIDYDVIRSIEKRGYVDVYSNKLIKFSTWTARRVDYIFTRDIPSDSVVGTYTHYVDHSDHIPLVVDIRV